MDDILKQLIHNAQSGHEVDKILSDNNILKPNFTLDEIKKNWHPIGNEWNNETAVRGQSPTPELAFGERVINSVDSVLMKKCIENNIDPRGAKAPKSMFDAISDYYGVPDGKLSLFTDDYGKITDIIAFATGKEEQKLTLNLVDFGEGQLPDFMPKSFLSLPFGKKSPYKIGINFVQGRYNQGGNGSYFFAKYTLIITKRAPSLLTENARKITDPSIEAEMSLDDAYRRKDEWGWTIVRKFPRKTDNELSWYGYYAPDGIIPSCNDSKLKLRPPLRIPTISRSLKGKQKQEALMNLRQQGTSLAYSESMESGTLVKLFDYPFQKCLRANFWSQGSRELRSKVFYNLGLPVRLLELREYGTMMGGSGEGDYLTGLQNSILNYDKGKNKLVKKGWPIGPDTINIPFDEINTDYKSASIEITSWIIEPKTETDQTENWVGDNSIIFTLNGQIQFRQSADYLSTVSRSKYIKNTS